MLKVYGTHICPDCEEALRILTEKGIPFEFCDFSQTTQSIKDFLKLRDTLAIFDEAKANGGIGIPCFVLDNLITLNLNDVLK